MKNLALAFGLLFAIELGVSCSQKPPVEVPDTHAPSAEQPESPQVPVSDALAMIQDGAAASSCAKYAFKDRGVPYPAYIRGMALEYARAVCNPDREDVKEASKAPAGSSRDALVTYASDFRALGSDDHLLNVYTLLLGLGMRESNGKYCEGRDASASNTASESAEAGIMQTSYDGVGSSAVLKNVFARYRYSDDGCLLGVFSKGITIGPKKTDHCSESDLKVWGTGQPGADFQRRQRECPALAVELAAPMIRLRAGAEGHWGPLRTKAAQARPECLVMFQKVKAIVKANPQVCAEI